MTLEEIREKIDAIDNQLLPLLTARLDCAEQVAAIKKESGGPVLNPQREQEILDRMETRSEKYGKEIRMLYAAFMESSRAIQHQILGSGEEIRALIRGASQDLPDSRRIACQGVEQAYSHQAALQLFPQGQPTFHPAFGDVFQALEEHTADFGILPVENSSAGSVSDVYDLILKYRFFIVSATTVHISHCLATPRGIRREQIQEIYSHPQALAQCADFIQSAGLKASPFSNTAAAAKMAAQTGGAIGVICSQQAAKTYGLDILSYDIQSARNNCTRFIAVCRNPVIPPNAQKISLCFSLSHTTGSLSSVLSRFALNGLNLTKIESRPLADKNFEYDFYLDFTGNVHQPKTLDLIASLHEELPRFSFLGNYLELE